MPIHFQPEPLAYQPEALLAFARVVRAEGLARNVPQISEETADYLTALLHTYQPKHLLELGTAAGYSALRFMAATAAWGADLVTIDISTPSFNKANSHFWVTGLLNTRVFTHFGDALFYLPKLPQQYFDFVFIDAEKKSTLAFFKAVVAMCHPHAVIVIDDVKKFAYKMPDFIPYVQTHYHYDWVETDADDALMVVRLQANQTSKTA